jgi:glutamine amidotransferase
MCEMMAFSFNRPLPAQHLVAALWRHGAKNPHGWGLAYYPDKAATVFKEPINAIESKLAGILAADPSLKAKLLIAHVRKTARSQLTQSNTHPFTRELDGREYVFAHNGNLKGFRDSLSVARFQPLGTTDSEFLFCHLLGKIDRQAIGKWKPQSFLWLEKELQAANKTGKMNCLFSDGTYLFAYHDANGYNGMSYLACRAPYGRVGFPSLSKKIDLSTVYPKSAAGVVVATKPLTDENWVKFDHGRLMVWKDGVPVFPTVSADQKEMAKK